MASSSQELILRELGGKLPDGDETSAADGSSGIGAGGKGEQYGSVENFSAAMDEAKVQMAQGAERTQPVLYAQGPAEADLPKSGASRPGDSVLAERGPVAGAESSGQPARSIRTDAAGDVILQGLVKIRGMFDEQVGKVNKMQHSPNVSDINELLKSQAELSHYALLVDISSKLTNKANQTIDMLLKG
jgi:hypothetical protein